MTKKFFINADEFYRDSFKLARQIFDSGFKPNFLIGIWRGGTPPGIVIQEFFKFKGIKTDHIAVRTDRYHGIDEKRENVNIYGLGYVIDNVNSEDNLLIVDDVIDEGITISALIQEIKKRARKNTPKIKIASVYYKPSRNKTNVKPDYFIHETDKWIVFPHEIEGLSLDELREKDEEIAKIVGE
jgi:hypothetical protein